MDKHLGTPLYNRTKDVRALFKYQQACKWLNVKTLNLVLVKSEFKSGF